MWAALLARTSESAVWWRQYGPRADRVHEGADCTAADLRRPRECAASRSDVRGTGGPTEMAAGPREPDEVRFEWPPTSEVSSARLRCGPGTAAIS
ncbi:hypothetical protein NDU88_004942 [Pleurodeles waltl]|uniref:Uncharacterized protein n=1 Tax=Pleurodeles waltl TaxID=8319 RepID=A0AAV7RMW2_PLEWA|nr:hypothetical protein NDU88_004942 [Pleurodeles waltl]